MDEAERYEEGIQKQTEMRQSISKSSRENQPNLYGLTLEEQEIVLFASNKSKKVK